jgi:hypothetical protein
MALVSDYPAVLLQEHEARRLRSPFGWLPNPPLQAAAERQYRWQTGQADMAVTVSITEVVDALELASDEMSSYVNRATGQVVTVSHEDLSLAEEDPRPDTPAWQQDTVAEAKRILESDDWLELPNKFDIHEWQIMNDFGASRAAESERAEIADAIHGSGAFRNFKGTIRRLGIEAAWFAYKAAALETIARDWLRQKGLLPNPALRADDQVPAERQ